MKNAGPQNVVPQMSTDKSKNLKIRPVVSYYFRKNPLRYEHPISIHHLKGIAYPQTLSRFLAPYVETFSDFVTMLNYTVSYYITFAEKLSAASQTRATKTSSANQNRVSRHPGRQSIRNEHYVTRKLLVSVEVPSRLSASVGWL